MAKPGDEKSMNKRRQTMAALNADNNFKFENLNMEEEILEDGGEGVNISEFDPYDENDTYEVVYKK